jgi:hypothetical protein
VRQMQGRYRRRHKGRMGKNYPSTGKVNSF